MNKVQRFAAAGAAILAVPNLPLLAPAIAAICMDLPEKENREAFSMPAPEREPINVAALAPYRLTFDKQ